MRKPRIEGRWNPFRARAKRREVIAILVCTAESSAVCSYTSRNTSLFDGEFVWEGGGVNRDFNGAAEDIYVRTTRNFAAGAIRSSLRQIGKFCRAMVSVR